MSGPSRSADAGDDDGRLLRGSLSDEYNSESRETQLAIVTADARDAPTDDAHRHRPRTADPKFVATDSHYLEICLNLCTENLTEKNFEE